MQNEEKIYWFNQVLKQFNYKNWQLLITQQIKESNIDLVKIEKRKIIKDISEKLDCFFEIKEEGIMTDISTDIIVIKRKDLNEIFKKFLEF